MNRTLWLIATFLAPFAVTGAAGWTTGYNEVQLPDALLGLPALFAIVVAALCRVFAPAPILTIAGIVCAAMVAVVSVRIGIDTAADPTTHNLLPFEITIAAFVGFSEGLIGALMGSGANWLVRRISVQAR